MTVRTCPDWPELMEIAPDLQFKHYTVRDAQLPAEALMQIPDLNLDEVEICCDLEHHVVYAAHTDAEVVQALEGTHWFEVHEWATSGPGASSHAATRRSGLAQDARLQPGIGGSAVP